VSSAGTGSAAEHSLVPGLDREVPAAATAPIRADGEEKPPA